MQAWEHQRAREGAEVSQSGAGHVTSRERETYVPWLCRHLRHRASSEFAVHRETVHLVELNLSQVVHAAHRENAKRLLR